MFLLVSVRHVGAHPDELQHGVSIQSSINLGKTFPRISRIRIIPSTQILTRVFVYLPPFISQILDLICQMVLIFILIYFEWRDTENQQLSSGWSRLTDTERRQYGMSIIRAKYKHRCPKLTLRLVWNVNRESESRYRRPLRRCMRNIILRSANAKFHYILPFFYKMNEGDLPLLYSCVFWRELGEFIDLVVFFFAVIVWPLSLRSSKQ